MDGLPLVKAGDNADVLTLDSEISADVDQVVKETKFRRNKILLEALRIGLPPYISRTMSEKLNLANVQRPEEVEQTIKAIQECYRDYDDPMLKEIKLTPRAVQVLALARKEADRLKHTTTFTIALFSI